MPNHVSRVITFPSANHSPSTVNRNAKEFVIGTVRLSSKGTLVSTVSTHLVLVKGLNCRLTCLTDQQEEPDASGQVRNKRDGIARLGQEADERPERERYLA